MSPRPLLVWLGMALAILTPARGLAQGSPFASGAWSGNLTPTSATVTIRLNASALDVRLVLSPSATLSPAKFFGGVTTSAASGNTVSIDAFGLEPNTDYFYGFEV